MAEGVIDTLQLNIVVNAPSATRINNLTTALQQLYGYLMQINGTSIGAISQNFTTLSTALASLNSGNKSLSGLTTRINSLNKAMQGLDTEVMTSKFAQMTAAIKPFLTELKSAEASLVALSSITKTSNAVMATGANKTATGGGRGGGGGRDGLYSFATGLYRLYFIFNIAKRLASALAKIVQLGIDYDETLNLWQTAMRGNLKQAREFTAEMNKAYGISKDTLMNYQAMFKNMVAALGNISEDSAYSISEALVQMALDFSSLYNTTVDAAMTKFQAVLAGQVRPIRTAGYDITEQTLYQLYKGLGGTKTVRQLNQTEKQMLRVLTVYKQMERSGATGDLQKTIQNTANQVRVMKEQWKEFTTWIGIAFNMFLENSEILIKINAHLIAFKELAKSVAYSLGYVEKKFNTIEWSDKIQNTNKELDKMQKKLLGFDKFQVLNSSAGESDIGVEQVLLDAISSNKSILEGVENPSSTKAVEILKALDGTLVEIRDNTGEVVDQMWKFPPVLGEVLKIVGSLIAAVSVLAITALYKKLATMVLGINGLTASLALLRVGGLGLLIYSVSTLIIKWDELTVATKVLMFAIAALGTTMVLMSSRGTKAAIKGIVTYTVVSIKELKSIIQTMILTAKMQGYLGTALRSLTISTLAFGAAVILAFAVFKNWDSMNGIQRVISVLGLLTVTCLGAAIAFGAFQSAWSLGIAAAAIVAGIVAVTAAINSAKNNISNMDVPKYAHGGLATKGSLFYAGEAGPELVTQTSGGGSTIMNMKQLEDAVARGMIRGAAATQGSEGQQITVNVSGRNLFSILVDEARSNGYELVKVR